MSESKLLYFLHIFLSLCLKLLFSKTKLKLSYSLGLSWSINPPSPSGEIWYTYWLSCVYPVMQKSTPKEIKSQSQSKRIFESTIPLIAARKFSPPYIVDL